MLRAVLACLCLCLASPAKAQNPRELMLAGQYDKARAALAVLVANLPTRQADISVFEAMILIHKGRRAEAVDLLRKVLIRYPNHEPARRELVFALAQAGIHDAALFHAERLVGETGNQQLAQDLSRYIASSKRGKSRGVALRFSFLPSNNFNQGTQARTIQVGQTSFDIDDGSRAKSGIGIAAGLTAWSRWKLGSKWDATVQGSIDVKDYPNRDYPFEVSLTSRLDFGRNTRSGRLSFGPTISLLRQNGQTYRTRVGLNFGLHHTIDRKRSLSANLTAVRQTYPGRRFRDGTRVSGAMNYRHVLSPSLVLSAALPFEIERTDRKHLDHTELGLSIGAAKDWRSGLSTQISIGWARDRYRGDFPGFTTPRSDTKRTIGLRIKQRKFQLFGHTPELSYTYTDARSNVEFYDYTSHDIGLNFTRQF